MRHVEGQEEFKALYAVLRPELVVAAQIGIPLVIADVEEVAQFGADGGDSRLERADPVAAAAIRQLSE